LQLPTRNSSLTSNARKPLQISHRSFVLIVFFQLQISPCMLKPYRVLSEVKTRPSITICLFIRADHPPEIRLQIPDPLSTVGIVFKRIFTSSQILQFSI
jgi:hypothetical protein